MGSFKQARRGRTLREVVTGLARAVATPPAPEFRYYVKLSRPAMACDFEVLLRPEDRGAIPSVVEALDEVEALEQQMSVYREESEISRINREAASRPVAVEERLYGLLRQARDLGAETGGAFDVTTGALIRAWGFLHRRGSVPEAGRLAAARACSGWEHLVLDDSSRTAAFLRSGLELNLGAIGKGFALDCVALRLRSAGLRNFLAHAGHSSIVASGDSASGQGWEVRLRCGAAESLGSLRLRDRAISTSSPASQFFESGGRRYGHILDPRSGRPAERNALCSVIAEDAASAEALSTALFVLTEGEVHTYFERHPGIGIILRALRKDGSPGAPVALGADLTGREETQ